MGRTSLELLDGALALADGKLSCREVQKGPNQGPALRITAATKGRLLKGRRVPTFGRKITIYA
jgi:hypothetical protein